MKHLFESFLRLNCNCYKKKNFSDSIIDKGGNGIVYKGKYHDVDVAIKESLWMKSEFSNDRISFWNEITLMRFSTVCCSPYF